jgi:hypothetical protein
MANEKQLIDASPVYEDLRKSYEELQRIREMLTNHEDIQICNGQLATYKEALLCIKNAPTVDAVPVAEIEEYLQARLDEWEALGDRKWEPANMWGYNFIRACFDDLERRNDGTID